MKKILITRKNVFSFFSLFFYYTHMNWWLLTKLTVIIPQHVSQTIDAVHLTLTQWHMSITAQYNWEKNGEINASHLIDINRYLLINKTMCQKSCSGYSEMSKTWFSALKDLPVQSTYLYPTLLGTTWPHSLLAHLALRPPALRELCMTSHDLMWLAPLLHISGLLL